MPTEQPPPWNLLKIWGVQAAQVHSTAQLISRLRTEWSLGVVISAPNPPDGTFRTTEKLIEAAQKLTTGDEQGTIETLESIKSFVLWLVFQGADVPSRKPNPYEHIKHDIDALFANIYEHIQLYCRKRSPTSHLFVRPPDASNDYTASIWKRPAHVRRWQPGLVAMIPFMELGENISAIIYAHLSWTEPILSRDFLGKSAWDVVDEVRQSGVRIIAGALRLSPRERILASHGRGYSDATAGSLATAAQFPFLNHKEYQIVTADPRIVNGGHIPVWVMSLEILQLMSMHPIIGTQFLNPHTFDGWIPPEIAIGDFTTGRVTRVVRNMVGHGFPPPIIQKWPRVSHAWDGQFTLWDGIWINLDPEWAFVAVSIIDHRPLAEGHIRNLWFFAPSGVLRGIGHLEGHVAIVLVPHEDANNMVRQIHEKAISLSA